MDGAPNIVIRWWDFRIEMPISQASARIPDGRLKIEMPNIHNMETQSCYPTEANGVLAYQWDAGHWVSHSVEGLHSIKDSFMRVTFLDNRFLRNDSIAKWKIPLRNFLSSETWLLFSSKQGLILSFRIEVFYMDKFSLFFGNMLLKSGPLTLTNSCKGKAYFERISKEELGRIIRTNNWTFTLESTEGNAGQLSLPPPIVIDYASKFQSASRIGHAEDKFWSLSYFTHLKDIWNLRLVLEFDRPGIASDPIIVKIPMRSVFPFRQQTKVPLSDIYAITEPWVLSLDLIFNRFPLVAQMKPHPECLYKGFGHQPNESPLDIDPGLGCDEVKWVPFSPFTHHHRSNLSSGPTAQFEDNTREDTE
eukprot:TRINITY_DN3399_c0_g1_i7.p1 TRINITY_DN3399_c0_g1~~TRINITY_DN3399_c0_g1_i7.p1  ORF type:complete len:362 (-),score=64.12 TRINITY_DN3399_c0_g1_i7:328-1413(-)